MKFIFAAELLVWLLMFDLLSESELLLVKPALQESAFALCWLRSSTSSFKSNVSVLIRFLLMRKVLTRMASPPPPCSRVRCCGSYLGTPPGLDGDDDDDKLDEVAVRPVVDESDNIPDEFILPKISL